MQQQKKGEISMLNQDIRNYAESHSVKLYEIAMRLGINDGNFSRKLRVELPDDVKARIYSIIDEISSNRTDGD